MNSLEFGINFGSEWWAKKPNLARVLKPQSSSKSHDGLCLIDEEGFEVPLYGESSEEVELLAAGTFEGNVNKEFTVDIEPLDCAELEVVGFTQVAVFAIPEELQSIKCEVRVNDDHETCFLSLEDGESGETLASATGYLNTYHWFQSDLGLFPEHKFLFAYSYAKTDLLFNPELPYEEMQKNVTEFMNQLKELKGITEQQTAGLDVLINELNAISKDFKEKKLYDELKNMLNILCDLSAEILEEYYKEG